MPEDDRFTLYWLSDAPFSMNDLAARTQRAYAALSRFFKSSDPSYRVFMRQNPYTGLGGTAFVQSFALGYDPDQNPTIDGMQNLLTHEMVHNWPDLEGEHGFKAWYTEGTAEYYSLLVAYRSGIISLDRFLASINGKARDYYVNPFVSMSNTEVAKLFWSDATAQTVPYGRGFMYLLATDAEIRARTKGKHSLDDVVLALRRRQVAGNPYGLQQWLALVGDEIGPKRAKAAYDAMAAGRVIGAPASRFAPCFKVERHQVRLFELGFARSSLNDARIIHGLLMNSAAAKAGVRDGDIVVNATDFGKIHNSETERMTMTLRREGQEITVSYLPRGASVPSWNWVRNTESPISACVF